MQNSKLSFISLLVKRKHTDFKVMPGDLLIVGITTTSSRLFNVVMSFPSIPTSSLMVYSPLYSFNNAIFSAVCLFLSTS